MPDADISNTPNPERFSEAKAYHAKRKQNKDKISTKRKEEVWYEAHGNKVTKKTKIEGGNTYSVYIGTRKQCDQQKIQYRVV